MKKLVSLVATILSVGLVHAKNEFEIYNKSDKSIWIKLMNPNALPDTLR